MRAVHAVPGAAHACRLSNSPRASSVSFPRVLTKSRLNGVVPGHRRGVYRSCFLVRKPVLLGGRIVARHFGAKLWTGVTIANTKLEL
jgi:hypothetical protein